MENILSKYERMAIEVVNKKGIDSHMTEFGETKRIWFGNEVWDNTLRLVCVSIDWYVDGTGWFLNTLWQAFDSDSMEYETLFRDLDEEMQKKIYEVIA